MKSKTTAAWLAFVLGPVGAHRFYLHGFKDPWGWLLPLPTALGLWGYWRALSFGVDDRLSWVLLPVLGLVIAACALTAIVYGLSSPERWNAKHNPGVAPDHAAGASHWGTVAALVLSLLVGTTMLMASLVYSFQRYFEVQIEQARQLSQ